MNTKLFLISFLVFFTAFHERFLAQSAVPSINPTAIYTTENGDEENADMSGSAPLTGRFYANPENTAGYTTYYEWRFTLEGETEPYIIRYEQDTEYTFTTAGVHNIVLYATFTKGTETIEYTQEYWADTTPLRVTISESKLDMPNAFSPNGDGINDYYNVYNVKSIVSFSAAIYNRWGQQLYSWGIDQIDCEDCGWDGTYKGKDVKPGVYYVVIDARGADGVRYEIRRDVNLLRGYTEETAAP